MSKLIYILNGPNLNLLGLREPEIYGQTSLDDIKAASKAKADAVGLATDFRQSNHEGELVDWVQEGREKADGFIVNLGAYTHTSVAILDALKACDQPIVEVHLSNLFAREDFRQHSYISPIAAGLICGFGAHGYDLAIEVEKDDLKIRVAREVTVAAAPAQVQAPAQADGEAVTAPMVGTVYLQPEPGAAQFVSVGDQVAEGQTLIIVEAMKTMNPRNLMFDKVLIANRGEIALRIHRACKEMGIQTVAVHSTADADAMHIVADHGITFIGPTADHIRMMGDKIAAKQAMIRLGVPVVPGSEGAVTDGDEVRALADDIGYPVLIKAAAGGGGRGMKVAKDAAHLAEALSSAKSESMAAFGDLGYLGAGTIEFLYENGEFYFIEMNTRLQVEHPVTEAITGIDLVREQIRVAAGEKLSFNQSDIQLEGHSIECRINAEHPETFTPSPGTVTLFHQPGGLGVRVDSAVYSGYAIPPYYDSMIAKLIVHGRDRPEAIMRMKRALTEFVVDGVDTTIPLHLDLIDEPDVKSGDYNIHWLERHLGLK
ncbi:accC1 [Symbiodinium microadriaticum]|nr:accC1 [Symbiodinium microadriaticum]